MTHRIAARIAVVAVAVAAAAPAPVLAQESGGEDPPAGREPAEAAPGVPSADSTGAADSSAAPAARRAPRSWTSDRSSFRVGDVLTVFVDERTLARAVSDNFAVQDRGARGFGAPLTGLGIGARTRLDTDSEERGRATREERYRTELSVRVEEITAGGVLRVEGHKRFTVDEHEQKVILAGWVRPEDVSLMNTVDGWRVANMELLYESNGELTETDKGILTKILGVIF